MDKQVIIKSSNLSATINYKGAELVSLKKDNIEYIWQGDKKYWASHCPVLFPICGGLKDDTIYLDGKKYTQLKHGFAKNKYFTLEEKTENSVTFLLKSDNETKIGFPFNFEFYVKFTLKHKLVISYVVKNVDINKMYFTLGAHEGYYLEDNFENYSIIFEEKEDLNSLVLDGNLLNREVINVGKNTNELQLKYDYFLVDALVFRDIKSRKVYLKNKDKGVVLSINFKDFNHLLLWTKPNAKYICIEPWIAVQDYVDSVKDFTKKDNIQILDSGKSIEYQHEIEIK